MSKILQLSHSTVIMRASQFALGRRLLFPPHPGFGHGPAAM